MRRSSGALRSGRAGRLAAAAGAAGGFTLLETLMALVIIGVGVLAFVDAQASFQKSNEWSSHAATGMLLANEIREMTRNLPRHDPVTGLAISATGGGGAILRGWGRETGEIAVDDLDDIDDLDGMIFGDGGTFPGPVDAFGTIVPEITINGDPLSNDDGDAIPLRGWRQRVIVEKVDPYNFSNARADSYEQIGTSQLPPIRVDQFPLRVTVMVEFQDVGGTAYEEVTRVTWVVPR